LLQRTRPARFGGAHRRASGLGFGALRNFDPLAVSEDEEEAAAVGFVIEEPEDIHL
jgi:hypothetical protein